jgi:tRNA-Thr(GGU) m(6)t(6)A37 methyltransferase TsaA
MNLANNISMSLNPIGVIHSSFIEARDTPIQPVFAEGSQGVVEVYEPYRQGLKDLEGFERIWLIYWFHRASRPRLLVKPYMDDTERGLFATRAPCRPNPIGISAVRLIRVENGTLYIEDVDILDGTPLLDIKPYVPKFDCFEAKRIGWFAGVKIENHTKFSDNRFCNT